MRKFVNQENCNAILATLTTFRRVSIRFENGENKKDEKFPTITSLLKENGIGHNYHSFIRDILVERKLVSVDLKKWNKQKAEPNIEMAKSIAQEAASKYPYLWIGTVDYTYFVSDDLDISNSTHLIYPHGGDIWGNIYDWKRLETNETA